MPTPQFNSSDKDFFKLSCLEGLVTLITHCGDTWEAFISQIMVFPFQKKESPLSGIANASYQVKDSNVKDVTGKIVKGLENLLEEIPNTELTYSNKYNLINIETPFKTGPLSSRAEFYKTYLESVKKVLGQYGTQII